MIFKHFRIFSFMPYFLWNSTKTGGDRFIDGSVFAFSIKINSRSLILQILFFEIGIMNMSIKNLGSIKNL